LAETTQRLLLVAAAEPTGDPVLMWRAAGRLGMPADDLCYAFNLVRIPATNDASEANRLVDANKATYGRVKAARGALYPVSAFPMSKGEWRDHFGSAFGQLDAAKQQYDPDEILTPGYEIF
jgi:cytokinin dehydrogenase